MARTRISPQTVDRFSGLADITFTSADATNDHIFQNDGRQVVLLKNDSGSSKSITVKSVADRHNRTGDLSLSASANSISVSPQLPRPTWNQAGTDDVHIDLSDDTSVSLAVLTIERPVS